MADEVVKRTYKKKQRPLNYQLVRVLRQADFSPLTELLEQVYPTLEPRDKMVTIFKIMDYLYAKPKPVETSKRKRGPVNQTNVQVNLPDRFAAGSTPQTHEDMVKLLEAAEEHKPD